MSRENRCSRRRCRNLRRHWSLINQLGRRGKGRHGWGQIRGCSSLEEASNSILTELVINQGTERRKMVARRLVAGDRGPANQTL